MRQAAIEALGVLGDGPAVPLLAGIACGTNELALAAQRALVRLAGATVEPAILEHLPAAPPPEQVALLRALADRRAAGCTAALLPLTRSPAADVRREAFRALGLLATVADVPLLLPLMQTAPAAADRDRAATALQAVLSRSPDAASGADLVIAALANADADMRARLLGLLGGSGNLRALGALVTDVAAADASVRRAALRALADWPDARPLEVLRDLGRRASDATERGLALRAYVAVLGRAAELPPDETARQLAGALAGATDADARRLLLGRLGQTASLVALTAAERCLDDTNVVAEAAQAYGDVAALLQTSDPDGARPYIEARVAAPTTAEALRERLRNVLGGGREVDGHIVCWVVSGPYTNAAALFDTVFPPETAEHQDVTWQPVNALSQPTTLYIRPGDVNLGALLGGNHRAAYLRTRVSVPTARDAILELGSDDGLKAWINGKLVCANNAAGALKRGSYRVQLRLDPGTTTLLLKVVQGTGEWGATARFTDQGGAPMPDLKYGAW